MSVYDEIEPAIFSVYQGYKVTILAYGQTGSGKTWTMEGDLEDESKRGVIFRSLATLFQDASSSENSNWDTTISVSIVEIYNEKIKDLLGEPDEETEQLPIREVRVGRHGAFVEGVIEQIVSSPEDVDHWMGIASEHRSVGSNNVNEHSSRSHLVMSVSLERTHKVSNEVIMGKLSLVDLAGSERLKKTGATGQRLKEAQNINRSLSALGDVISALGSSAKHIPYRNSKLTFLLQDSLSANSKMIMFLNINPIRESSDESLCSINFASRCRQVQLGQAKKMAQTPLSPTAKQQTSQQKLPPPGMRKKKNKKKP